MPVVLMLLLLHLHLLAAPVLPPSTSTPTPLLPLLLVVQHVVRAGDAVAQKGAGAQVKLPVGVGRVLRPEQRVGVRAAVKHVLKNVHVC